MSASDHSADAILLSLLSRLPNGASTTAPLAAIAVTVAFVIAATWLLRRPEAPPFPVVGKAGTWDFRAAMNEGNEKYPNKPFILPFQDPTVVLPISCIDAIKGLPDAQLSTNGNMAHRFAVKYTGSGWVDPELAAAVKLDLTRDVQGLLPEMAEELGYALDAKIGRLDGWAEVPLQQRMSEVVSLVTGRAFVGLPTSRDPAWIEATMNHPMAVMMFAAKLRFFPRLLRPLAARLLPDIRAVRRTKSVITGFLRPLIDGGETSSSSSSSPTPLSSSSSTGGQSRMMTWLSARYLSTRGPSFDRALLARDYFTLCFAAKGFPSIALTHAVLDLAAYPHHLPELRAEIERERALAPGGVLTAKSLARLVLLDSFVKESARLGPPGVVAWLRKTHRALSLPTGDVVPPETLVAVCNPRFDRGSGPWGGDADAFDGFRYARALAARPEEARFQLAATHRDDLVFGLGTHACPGRFFAAAELKLVLAELVTRYDFRLEDGVEGRPENVYMDFMIMPPPAKVFFKSR